MNRNYLFFLFLFPSISFSSLLYPVSISEVADSSDIIAIFNVYISKVDEHFAYFKNGIKRNVGTSATIYGFVKKVIKGKYEIPPKKFITFKFNSPVNCTFDSLGIPASSWSTISTASGKECSTLPDSTYIFLFNVNINENDTFYVLKRVEPLEEICKITKYFKDKDIVIDCNIKNKSDPIIIYDKKFNEDFQLFINDIKKKNN